MRVLILIAILISLAIGFMLGWLVKTLVTRYLDLDLLEQREKLENERTERLIREAEQLKRHEDVLDRLSAMTAEDIQVEIDRARNGAQEIAKA